MMAPWNLGGADMQTSLETVAETFNLSLKKCDGEFSVPFAKERRFFNEDQVQLQANHTPHA